MRILSGALESAVMHKKLRSSLESSLLPRIVCPRSSQSRAHGSRIKLLSKNSIQMRRLLSVLLAMSPSSTSTSVFMIAIMFVVALVTICSRSLLAWFANLAEWSSSKVSQILIQQALSLRNMTLIMKVKRLNQINLFKLDLTLTTSEGSVIQKISFKSLPTLLSNSFCRPNQRSWCLPILHKVVVSQVWEISISILSQSDPYFDIVSFCLELLCHILRVYLLFIILLSWISYKISSIYLSIYVCIYL